MKKTSYKPVIYKTFAEYKNNHKDPNKRIDHELYDTLDLQVSDLIKLQHPSNASTPKFLEAKKEAFFKKHNFDDYGNWVFYPWRNAVIRTLPEEAFIQVRTVRNKYKITDQEQQELRSKKIGVVGLSVGQSVAVTMAMERIGGTLRLADYDHLELSNMNRLRSSLLELGGLKTLNTARQIAEIDPYLKTEVFNNGITKENIDDFIGSGDQQLDLIIDECDALAIKLLLRLKAKQKGIPVIMDTSDRGMLDIERYDIEPDHEPFHGCLSSREVDAILNEKLKPKEMVGVVKKIVDEKTMSKALKHALGEIGKTITTWPQLASSVTLGGGAAATAARKIVLKEPIKSGRYFIDVEAILNK